MENIETQNNIVIESNQGGVELESLSKLFSKSFALYEKRFWKFAGIILANMLLMLGLIAIMVGFGAVGLSLSGKYLFGPVVVSIALILSIIGIIVISVWSKASLLVAIRDSEEKIGVRTSFRRGWRYSWWYFIVGAITGFVTLAGLALFFVPGIILSIMMVFAAFVLVVEDEKGMSVFVKSRNYIRGLWWDVFGRIVVIGVVAMAISFLPGIGGLLFSFFAYPFMMVYIFFLYKDLKRVKETQIITAKKDKNTKILFVVFAILGICVVLASVTLLGKLIKNKVADGLNTAEINKDFSTQEVLDFN